MEKNKVKILFLDRNAVGPYELKHSYQIFYLIFYNFLFLI